MLDATDSRGYNLPMNFHIHGTYRSGVIYPERPLALPDDTKVELVVTMSPTDEPDANAAERAARSDAPNISDEELEDRLRRFGVSVGTLPVDFSRSDIYDDHD